MCLPSSGRRSARERRGVPVFIFIYFSSLSCRWTFFVAVVERNRSQRSAPTVGDLIGRVRLWINVRMRYTEVRTYILHETTQLTQVPLRFFVCVVNGTHVHRVGLSSFLMLLQVTYLRSPQSADDIERGTTGRRTSPARPPVMGPTLSMDDSPQVSYSCVDYSCGDWFAEMCQSVFRSGATSHHALPDDPQDLMSVDA